VKLTLAVALLLTGGTAAGLALASTPTQAAWAMVLALLMGVALFELCWFRLARAVRRRALEGWRDWLEYRAALKKDEARRKAVRSRRP
jgi:hypothetical protein